MVMRKLREREDGFTLIEVLIVIAIIAILVAVAIPVLHHAKQAGSESGGLQVLKSLRNGEETYFAANKTYGNLTQLQAVNFSPVGEGGVEPASGYTFTTIGSPTIVSYTLRAMAPTSGMASYEMDQTGIITTFTTP